MSLSSIPSKILLAAFRSIKFEYISRTALPTDVSEMRSDFTSKPWIDSQSDFHPKATESWIRVNAVATWGIRPNFRNRLNNEIASSKSSLYTNPATIALQETKLGSINPSNSL
ncbi:hypothetical protein PanWU01x14_171470 [Parasponia andersonii]|uniref:Uncharacterized protein n=1 Tax=Parasponia andersonii TaxID=3476 RepID=A0A2P5C9W7_PARAD|nr:hypothetical protein PanWU01x14_171470 [Parasponia andersonii]